jgi:hypothetical protein
LLIGIPALPGLTSLIKQFVIRDLQVVTSNFSAVIFVRINIANIIYKIVSRFEISIRTPATPLRHSAHHYVGVLPKGANPHFANFTGETKNCFA